MTSQYEVNQEKELATARIRAVAVAVHNAVKRPGTPWVVIHFVDSHPWHFHAVDVASLTTAKLAPYTAESPTYRAVINSDLSVSIVNGRLGLEPNGDVNVMGGR
jgi:hypothetical protein